MNEISPAGIGLRFVRCINASCWHSWTWFKTEVPADSKKTPAKRRIKEPVGELPVRKNPVMAENVTRSDSRTLISLDNIEIYCFKLFFFTGCFEIIDNFIEIFSLDNGCVRLHQSFVETFDDFDVWI